MLLIIETWRLMLRLFLSPVNPILIIQRNDGLVVYFWNLMIFFIILLLIIGQRDEFYQRNVRANVN